MLRMLVVAVTVAACGCATHPLGGVGRPAPHCRADSVLYCEVDAHLDIEACQCVQRRALRDALRQLAMR